MLFLFGLLIRHGETGLEPTVLSMPITGFFYGLVFRPNTYFNEDTAIMFRESVHHAVTEAIDQVTSAQGVRGLSEEARKITFQPQRCTQPQGCVHKCSCPLTRTEVDYWGMPGCARGNWPPLSGNVTPVSDSRTVTVLEGSSAS